MTDKNDSQPVSLKLAIISVLLVILIFMSGMYLASWLNYNSFIENDNECRVCASEHNLTCIEKEPIKNLYMAINNINATYFDCITSDYKRTWDSCKLCYAINDYRT